MKVERIMKCSKDQWVLIQNLQASSSQDKILSGGPYWGFFPPSFFYEIGCLSKSTHSEIIYGSPCLIWFTILNISLFCKMYAPSWLIVCTGHNDNTLIGRASNLRSCHIHALRADPPNPPPFSLFSQFPMLMALTGQSMTSHLQQRSWARLCAFQQHYSCLVLQSLAMSVGDKLQFHVGGCENEIFFDNTNTFF